jgi:hypothetical protein
LECGRARLVSERHARRAAYVCNLCRHPTKKQPPSDSDRRFWLNIFLDEEIIEIAFWLFGKQGDIECVREWREILFPDDEFKKGKVIATVV